MKRYFLWTLCLIVMLPVAAQDDSNLYSSKGKDFYFTLWDLGFGNDTTDYLCGITIALDIPDFVAPYTFYTNPDVFKMNDGGVFSYAIAPYSKRRQSSYPCRCIKDN